MSKYRKKDDRFAYEVTELETQSTTWIVFELTRCFNMYYSLRYQYKGELRHELNKRIQVGGLSRDEKRLIKVYFDFEKTIEILRHNHEVKLSRSQSNYKLK